MEACSFQSRRSAHDSDHFLGCDCQPPNHRAHRRWFIFVVIVFALAILAALVDGMLKAASDMVVAFPDLPSLAEGAAWDKLFAGFGRVAALVLAFVIVAMLFKRRRKAKSRSKT